MPEPITFDQAAAHLRLGEDESERELIESYIVSAREWVERYTGKILVQRDVTQSFTRFSPYLQLSWGPVVSVSSIAYVDADQLSSTFLDFALRDDRVAPVLTWPVLGASGVITVTYSAGYEPDDLPQFLCQAILQLVALWYDNRDETAVPPAVMALCRAERPVMI